MRGFYASLFCPRNLRGGRLLAYVLWRASFDIYNIARYIEYVKHF